MTSKSKLVEEDLDQMTSEDVDIIINVIEQVLQNHYAVLRVLDNDKAKDSPFYSNLRKMAISAIGKEQTDKMEDKYFEEKRSEASETARVLEKMKIKLNLFKSKL